MRRHILRSSVAGCLAALFAVSGAVHAAETDVTFDIVRFEVEGNSLIPADKVQTLVAPFIGRKRLYGDIQKALEALDNEYRRMGFGTVNVIVPEQELTTGVVKLSVVESVVGKVTVTGNNHFKVENIRSSLPLLQEGRAPNMRQLSESIQLANENPAKQVEVTLGLSDDEGKVDARVEVADEDPQKVIFNLDNTGTKATGKHRVGVSYQNANIADSDQVLTLAYNTALDAPSGVKVDIFSLGYRMPLYALGDSIDVIYANSGTNTPAVLATGLAVNGKGEVFAVRYNHIFPRAGEYTSKLVLGYDYKYINSRCTTGGVPSDINPPNGVAGCTPYTLRPVTATYSGQWMKPGEAIDFNIGGTYHAFPMGDSFTGPAGLDRYSRIANGNRQGNDNFSAYRLGGSYSSAVGKDWLVRAAFTGQYATNPLPAGEQIGLAGSSAVRGFLERAVAADRGYVANFEVYSPDYAGEFGLPGNLKGLAFFDLASGNNLQATATMFARANIASAGIGLRYNLKKDISAKFDVARVMEGHQPTPGNSAEAAKPGDIRGHFSMSFGF